MDVLLGKRMSSSVYGICCRILTHKKTVRTYTAYLKYGEPRERMCDANGYKINSLTKVLLKRVESNQSPLWFQSRHEIVKKLQDFRDGVIKIDNPSLESKGN